MNAIRKLWLENFQSHERSEIEFVPGLNVIVGPSDQGKSAIIRALRWVLFNEPRGSDFIRTGASSCQVTVELASGDRIVRLRGTGKNRYTLIRADGTEQVFEGFGTGVPKEITDAHGMPQVYLDAAMAEPLNFSYQLDGPFLLSETGATKAKAIGRLSGVQVIDAALRRLLRDLTTQQQEERRLAEADAMLAERLKEYDGLPQMAADLARGEAIEQGLRMALSRSQQFSARREQWNAAVSELERTQATLTRLDGLAAAEAAITEAGRLDTLAVRLTAAQERLKNLQNERLQTEAIIARTKDLPAAEAYYHQLTSRAMVLSRLTQSRDSMHLNAVQLATLAAVLSATQNLARLETELLPRSAARLRRLQSLEPLAVRAWTIRREIIAQIASTQRLAGVPKAAERLQRLTGLSERRRELQTKNTAWQENRRSRAAGQEYLAQNTAQISKLIAAYRERLTELGQCPVCFSPIDPSSVAQIIATVEREALNDAQRP